MTTYNVTMSDETMTYNSIIEALSFVSNYMNMVMVDENVEVYTVFGFMPDHKYGSKEDKAQRAALAANDGYGSIELMNEKIAKFNAKFGTDMVISF